MHITLPKHQLTRVKREIGAGEADSVPDYITSLPEAQEKRDSLRVLLRDLTKQHGKPSKKETKWAERMLPRHVRG